MYVKRKDRSRFKKEDCYDKDAFVNLIELNKQSLYKVAHGFFSEQMDIDDVIADTVLSCWTQLERLITYISLPCNKKIPYKTFTSKDGSITAEISPIGIRLYNNNVWGDFNLSELSINTDSKTYVVESGKDYTINNMNASMSSDNKFMSIVFNRFVDPNTVQA